MCSHEAVLCEITGVHIDINLDSDDDILLLEATPHRQLAVLTSSAAGAC